MISKLILLLSLAVFAAPAWGQGLAANPPGRSGGGKTLALFPLTTSGALMDDSDPTVASHVVWNGTALVELKGITWSQAGTVPQVTANPFTTTRFGAGPFTASNYYSNSTLTMEASDFSICVVFTYTGGTAAQMLVAKDALSQRQFRLDLTANALNLIVYKAGGTSSGSGNRTPITTGPNVYCASYRYVADGSSVATGMVNLSSAAVSNAVGPIPASTASLEIGRRSYAGSEAPLAGVIYEVIIWKGKALTTAEMSEIQKKVFGNYDGYGPLSVTRSTTANATVNGVRWPFPASIGRITADGLLVEPARTQYVLNNSTHPKTAEVTGSLSTGAHVAWAEGAGNFTIEVDGATATGLPCTQAVGVVCSFTVTGAGTLKVTTDATVTTASVENGTFPTSFITTATGATTRNADQVTATIPTPPTNWCMALTALPESGRTWLEGGWPLTTTNVAANANGIQFLTDYFYVNDAAGNYKRLPYAAPSSAEHRLVGCATATTPVMSIDGVPVVGTISGTGTGILNPATTVLHFGQRSNGTVQFGGYLKNVKFCSAKAPKDCK